MVTFAVSFVVAVVVTWGLLTYGYHTGYEKGEHDGYIRALRWVRHYRDHGFRVRAEGCPTCEEGAP